LAVAAALRIAVMALYSPSVLQWVDAIRYLRIAPTQFFGDPWAPAGYPAFLKAIHLVSSSLIVTIAAQHALGLIAGACVYLLVRRTSGPPWLGLLPAGILLFSGDYLFLEHILMSDMLFTALVSVGVYAAVRGLDEPYSYRWLVISGVIIAASALVRSITLPFPVIMAVWILIVTSGSFRRRLGRALALLVPAAALVGTYLIVATAVGPYSGLGEMGGWDLYVRAAPFANCADFTPPAGTRVLCEATPPAARPGGFYYDWVPTSPGRLHFPHNPAGAEKVGAFARAAILSQPVAYAKAVVKDLARYVDPTIGTNRPYAGIPYALYSFEYRNRAEEQLIGHAIEHKGYTDVLPVHAGTGGTQLLTAYQTVFHVGGLPTLVFALLALAGSLFDRGRRRHVTVLLTICSFLLFALPVLTLSYDVRYGWPPEPLLAAAAALAAVGLIERARLRTSTGKGRRTPAAPEPN
jgi:4-amino-4-deoxy-L-arabinose transferase-like glycosyltransferase